jgi:CBS domain-containing protein
MNDHHTKQVLVVDTILEKHLLGVINSDDITAMSLDQSVKPSALNAEQCMKPLAHSARETSSLEECERILEEENLEQLAIVDEVGHLCGIFDRQSLAITAAQNTLPIADNEVVREL